MSLFLIVRRPASLCKFPRSNAHAVAGAGAVASGVTVATVTTVAVAVDVASFTIPRTRIGP